MKIFKKTKEAAAMMVELVIVSPVLFVVILYGVGDYIKKNFKKAKVN